MSSDIFRAPKQKKSLIKPDKPDKPVPKEAGSSALSNFGRFLLYGLLSFIFISFFVLSWVFIGLYVNQTNNIDVKQLDYDYVIIGAGAGGCAAAYQISKNKNHRILILEAGPDLDGYPPVSLVTNGAPLFLEDNYYNELFYQNMQAGDGDTAGVGQYTGGRLGGGSTSINNMQWVQGTNWLWDFVYNSSGHNQLWNATNVLENFKEMESLICSSCNTANHGYSGPLSILELMNTAPQTTATSMSIKLAQAFAQLSGLPIIQDYNNMTDSNRVGSFTEWQLSAYPNGTRSSATVSILKPLLKAQNNVKIIYNSFVSKILFDDSKRANRVLFSTDGDISQVVNVAKEVIVTAGVNTPAILLHSGIGSESYLRSIKVNPVVAENPLIGTTIWNHQVYVAVYTKNASDVPSLNTNDLYEGGAFMPLAVNFTFPHAVTESVGPRAFQFTGTNVGAPANLMVLSAFNVVPQSVGSLFIRNNDPLRPVAENDNLYIGNGGANDLALVFSLYKTYFCGINAQFQGNGTGPAVDKSYLIIDPPAATCANSTLLQTYVNNYLPAHTHHWTGQCPIGTDATNGAVDALGRVFGVKGLRVADATVLPHSADGNTQAIAYQIGWNVGKAILQGLTN